MSGLATADSDRGLFILYSRPRALGSPVRISLLRPVVKLEPRDVRKVSGIPCHQDPLLFKDNRSNAEIIRTDTTMVRP